MDKTYTMASKDVLDKRLSEKAFDHFNEKTNLTKNLAGTEKAAMGVAVAVELAMIDYAANLKTGGMPPFMVNMTLTQMSMNKPMMLEALLKEHPEALEELKSKGLYTPIK